MGQTVYTLNSNSIIPITNRLGGAMNDTWTGAYIGNGYTKLVADTSTGKAIKELVIGYGSDYALLSPITHNDPATFGGQSTPVTPWLSPAQDDSWAPRYQVSPAVYQETTQVPSQSVPLMTHVYALGSHSGIWRIAYVIDDNSFVVWDPMRTADSVTFDSEELMYMCQNTNPATKVQFISSLNTDTLGIKNIDGVYGGDIAGPFNMEFNPNQEGIVEPFVALASGNVMAIVTY